MSNDYDENIDYDELAENSRLMLEEKCESYDGNVNCPSCETPMNASIENNSILLTCPDPSCSHSEYR